MRIGMLLIIVSVMALLIRIVTLAGRSNPTVFPVEGAPEVGFARDMALHHSQANYGSHAWYANNYPLNCD